MIDHDPIPWESLDEQQLVEHAKRDPTAMSILYRRHYPIIHRYVAKRVATSHDVHDIVADVFLTMVRELPRYRWTGAPFQAWLFRIATSQISRWVRNRKWFRFWAPFDDQLVANSPEPRDSEGAQALRFGLLQLPCRYQDTLTLFYLEDLSIKSIAEILKVEEGTVKARLSRGRQMLKAILEHHRTKENHHKEPSHERRTIPSVLQRTQE